jgi:hypothetical protein
MRRIRHSHERKNIPVCYMRQVVQQHQPFKDSPTNTHG